MRYSPGIIAEKIRLYGYGRVVSDIGKRVGISQDAAFAFTRVTKRIAHPIDWLRRKNTRSLKSSTWSSALPDKEAWRIFAPDEVPGSIDLARACRSFAESGKPSWSALDGTYVYLMCNGGPKPSNAPEMTFDLDLVPGVLDFALSKPIVHAATGYLGEIPTLSSVTLYASLPNNSLQGPQRYHRDQIDRRMFKVLVAINDIDSQTGPFTLIPADKTEKVQRETGYRRGRISDSRVFDVIDPDDKIIFTGSAGSVMFCDSSRCLHHGSRGNVKTRILLEILYCSRFSQAESGMPLLKQNFDRERFVDSESRILLGI